MRWETLKDIASPAAPIAKLVSPILSKNTWPASVCAGAVESTADAGRSSGWRGRNAACACAASRSAISGVRRLPPAAAAAATMAAMAGAAVGANAAADTSASAAHLRALLLIAMSKV
jgi:hypothetical protein